jgi:hypothetical protein
MVITTEGFGNVVMGANSNVIVVQRSKAPEIINQKAPGGHAPITMKRQEMSMRGSLIPINDSQIIFPVLFFDIV